MPKVRVAGLSMSIDGYSAGPDQCLADPLGQRGFDLFQWYFPTRAFRAMHAPATKGEPGEEPAGETGIDNDFATHSMSNFGAFVLGRNMFGPVRGPWPDESWRGWWGDEPPFHAPTFVLTHYARDPIPMKGGTTFHFVTDGVESALAQAKAAAAAMGPDKDVKIGGGVSTVRQYLAINAIDEIHLAVSPVILGRGESLLAGIDLAALGFAVTERVQGERAMHVVLTRSR